MTKHVSELNSTELLRLMQWLRQQDKDLVDVMMETAGTLTEEQEEVANGNVDQSGRDANGSAAS